MKTTLHTYKFDTNNPKEAKAYRELAEKLRKTPGRGHWMKCLAMPGDDNQNLKTGEIELELEHLYENQWNANVGRVFDWYEGIYYSYGNKRTNIKKGHYLDITPEMIAVRNETLKCGYTGHQFPASSGLKFNTLPSAIGSEYLKETELHLLRLLPASTPFNVSRKPLTDAERAELLPLYVEAQTKAKAQRDFDAVHAGKCERALSQHQKDVAEFEEKVALMQKRLIEFKAGWQFLFDKGLNTQNVIYYNHTGQFSFGWRGDGFSPAVAAEWEKLTQGFPAPFKICRLGDKKA